MKQFIRVGSRDSALALAQTEQVLQTIRAFHPELKLEVVPMKTTGDRILDRTLDQIGGKGLFVKELDRALESGEVDFCVHSLKDMPMEQSEGLPILAYSKREDPRDVMVLPSRATQPDFSKPIGCSSARRRIQLADLYPNVPVEPVRGNLQTRFKKLETAYSALILAKAGLARLGLTGRIYRTFSPEELLPAAGQGILAVQGRAGDDYQYLTCVDDQKSRWAADAERAFVKALDGGCTSPVAAYARLEGELLRLTGLYYVEHTGQFYTSSLMGTPGAGASLGETLAERMRSQYGKGD